MKKIILSILLFICLSIIITGCNNKKYIINFETNSLFDIESIEFSNIEIIYHLKNNLILLIISIVSATPLIKNIIIKLRNTKVNKIIMI